MVIPYALLWLLLTSWCCAESSGAQPLLSAATESDLQAARQVVHDAIARGSQLNNARVASPVRNRYVACN
jgi:hypothetical protein